jgi:hypothetical protein
MVCRCTWQSILNTSEQHSDALLLSNPHHSVDSNGAMCLFGPAHARPGVVPAANKYTMPTPHIHHSKAAVMPHVHSSAHMRMSTGRNKRRPLLDRPHKKHHTSCTLCVTPRSITSMMLNQCSSTALPNPRINRMQDKRLSACARGCAPARQS